MKKTHISILLAVLFSGISSAAYAEFNLDKLKAIAEKAKAYQEKVNQGAQQPSSSGQPAMPPSTDKVSDLSTNDPSIALFNADAQNLATKYDVAGIKTGMSIAEARAAINKKTHLKVHRESEASLVFRTIDDSDSLLGKFIKDIIAETDNFRRGTGNKESLSVRFSPAPGHERVVEVTRDLRFSKENRPKSDEYMNALIEKYGQPVISEKSGQTIYAESAVNKLIWFFDHQGNPAVLAKTPGLFQEAGRGFGSGCFVHAISHVGAGDVTPRTTLGDERVGKAGSIQRPDRATQGSLHRCGSLAIIVTFGNSTPRGLLDTVMTTMTNVSLAAESSLIAGRKLEEAEVAYRKSRLLEAKKLKKPDL
jgi:hypothetical protein